MSFGDDAPMKQPIKRLEIPISKFNDIAIPHHLELLRQHKCNIKKYRDMRDWDKVQREQINALRLVKQLEQLLYEMDTLRGQVETPDIDKFDQLTSKSRNSTIEAIKEYLEIKFELSERILSPQIESQEDTQPLDEHFLQLQDQEEDIRRQETCLHAWNSLQSDLQSLHQLFVDFNKMIHDQREHVDHVENLVADAHVNVHEGKKSLEQASRLKVAAYPFAGALIGSCLGGPVGMIAGIKLGGLTALGCGVIGFTGATLLKNKQLESLKQNDDSGVPSSTSTNQGSLDSQDNPMDIKKDL